jgi:hypothetical protein
MLNLLSRTFSIVAAREHREHLVLWCIVASLPYPESPCNPMHVDVRGADSSSPGSRSTDSRGPESSRLQTDQLFKSDRFIDGKSIY